MSYALHGAGLLDEALDSTGFVTWGEAGKGTWVTIYAKSGHAYMVVAGLRFDTSGRADQGTRWQADDALVGGLHRPPPRGSLTARTSAPRARRAPEGYNNAPMAARPLAARPRRRRRS